MGQFCALKMPQSGSILRAQYHKGIKRSKTQADEGLTPADEAGYVFLSQPPAARLLASTPSSLGKILTNFHVRAAVLVELVHAADDRLLTCPLVPYDILNARTSSRLPRMAFWLTIKIGDSIEEVRIVRRRAAVPDGSTG